MKLLNIIKEDDELSDEDRNKILKRGDTIYKLLKKGTFSLGGETKWSKKYTFKYVLSNKYNTDISWDFVSEDSNDLKASCLLCVEEIYILFPYMSPGFRSDMVIHVKDKLYNLFKKYDVHLYVGNYGRCKRINQDSQQEVLGIKIIDDQGDWYNLFGEN